MSIRCVRLAATLMCRHAASIIVKMWLPVWLGTHGRVGSAVAAMLLMYSLEVPQQPYAAIPENKKPGAMHRIAKLSII